MAKSIADTSDKELQAQIEKHRNALDAAQRELDARKKKAKNEAAKATKKAVKQPPRPMTPMTKDYGVKDMVYPEGHPYAGKPVLYAGRGVVPEPLKAWMKSPEGIKWRDNKKNTTMLPLLVGIKVKGLDNEWTPEHRKEFWERVSERRLGRPKR